MQSINKFTEVSATYKGKFPFTVSSVCHVSPTTHCSQSRPRSSMATLHQEYGTPPPHASPSSEHQDHPHRSSAAPYQRAGVGSSVHPNDCQILGQHLFAFTPRRGRLGCCRRMAPIQINPKYDIYSATVSLNNLNLKGKKKKQTTPQIT